MSEKEVAVLRQKLRHCEETLGTYANAEEQAEARVRVLAEALRKVRHLTARAAAPRGLNSFAVSKIHELADAALAADTLEPIDE